MKEAIFFSILTIFVFLGIHKAVELLQSLFTLHLKNTVLVMYEIKGDEQEAEMIVRELAGLTKSPVAPAKTAVYIVSDDMDDQTEKLCRKTADQYRNVFVGNFSDAKELLVSAKEKRREQ